MRTIIFVSLFALVATVAAFSEEDISSEMREVLDRFVDMRRKWHEKWMSMSEAGRQRYERVFNERLADFPQIDLKRIHDLVEKKMSDDQQHTLREYLEERFQSVHDSARTSDESGETVVSDLEKIDLILKDIPKAIRDRIHHSLNKNFQEASSFAVSVRKVN